MALKRISESRSVTISYLHKLLDEEDEEAIIALDNFIEDIHKDKNYSSNYLLNHRNSDKFIWKFLELLNDESNLVIGNIAFILGTLSEFPNGRSKIIAALNHNIEPNKNGLNKLLELLSSLDTDVVMNAAGTIGTLIESQDGRDFLLRNIKSLGNFLNKINCLLRSDNLWTSSNAALITARLSIDDFGNSLIFQYKSLDDLLRNLIHCLGVDNAGRGMNAAFALGRILDNEVNLRKYWSMLTKWHLVEKLSKMVSSDDMACVKNACFCLNALAVISVNSEKNFSNSQNGGSCEMLLSLDKSVIDQLIKGLEKNLLLTDDETVWFVVLIVKSLTKSIHGVKIMRKYAEINSKVKNCYMNPIFSDEVKEECQEIMANLSPLFCPQAPDIQLESARQLRACWKYPKSNRLNLEIKAFLYYQQNNDDVLAYRGTKSEVVLNNLEPNTTYEFYLRFADDLDFTDPSNKCIITTDEDVPSEPINLRAIVRTSTQLKVSWEKPLYPNGVIKYYTISINEFGFKLSRVIKKYLFPSQVGSKDSKSHEQTTETISIISGLKPEKKYIISVSAINSAGKGKFAIIEVSTVASGAHAPEKPNVVVLGRFEAHISWNPPEEPLGKLFRYDVKINRKKLIYSGPNLYCKATSLRPNTEYTFSVIVVTSEGKYESPIVKKKTPKDEYSNIPRAPLYERKSSLEYSKSGRSEFLANINNKNTQNLDTVIRRYSDINVVTSSNGKLSHSRIHQLPSLRQPTNSNLISYNNLRSNKIDEISETSNVTSFNIDTVSDDNDDEDVVNLSSQANHSHKEPHQHLQQIYRGQIFENITTNIGDTIMKTSTTNFNANFIPHLTNTSGSSSVSSISNNNNNTNNKKKDKTSSQFDVFHKSLSNSQFLASKNK